MSLAAGDKLGPYQILALIGKGGMGEVYKAHDPRTGRDVAVKVSAEQFSERFDREVRVVAALNHPNICTLYDVGPNYLVMEFIEGESPQGPLPLETVLNYARQMAAALEEAHEKGIVHRDLKPANIKIKADGTVKVLDFGLAKVTPAKAGATQSENSPTLSMAATQVGVILGTAAYMAPEQARGRPIDKRADIWAFGVVLHEMLTGKRLFKGDDLTEVLASVVKEEPDWEQVPARIRKVVQACLKKDPKDRLRDIADARLMLLDETPAEAAAAGSSKLAWIVAAALSIALGAASFIAWRATRPVEHPLVRLSVDLGPDAVAGERTTAAISPDGTRIAFRARAADGKQMLAIRSLDQSQGIVLPGTENAADPFFSPDGQNVGFVASGKVKKVSVQGGAPVTLADSSNSRGASWGEDGNIVAALSGNVGLSLIPEAGGTPRPLTKLGTGEATHRWPQVLPGGKAVLFTLSGTTATFEDATLAVASLETGQVTNLKRRGAFGRYVPSNGSTGHLLYLDQGVLFGVPFDPTRLEMRGSPVPLLEDVAADAPTAGGQFDVSRNGTLLYLAGKGAAQTWTAAWLDSMGKTQPLLSKSGSYYTPRISPDGQRVVVAVSMGKGEDLYVYDPQHDSMTRLTFKEGGSTFPVWAPDGKHIAYRISGAGTYRIEWIRSDGGGEPQILLDSKNDVRTFSFTPDGRRLAYFEIDPETGNDLWTLPIDISDPEHPKAQKPEVFLRTPLSEQQPEFSPDGRWMAYTSNESGRAEIYVRPFPGPGGKWQVSSEGGTDAKWSRNGRELFFETPTPDNRIMVADYAVKGDSFAVVGKPRLWSDVHIYGPSYVHKDLTPDGKRFVVFLRPEAAPGIKGNLHLTFLLNFFEELRRRAPAGGK
jgi:Tol biopolymer transport system component/predicted Ser/Thr protein kinase